MISIIKPGIVLLVLWTAIVGIKVASPNSFPVSLSFFVLVGLWLAASGASALNHLLDKDIDSLMDRTRSRPIPLGKISPKFAFIIGLTMTVTGVGIFIIRVNLLSAFLLMLTVFLYVPVYTLFKRRSPFSVVMGSLIGALPPIIGYTSVSGYIGWDSILLGLLMFLWQPPHFLALSLGLAKDYSKAKIPIFPLVYGDFLTKLQILTYGLALFLVTLTVFLSRNAHQHIIYFVTFLGCIYIILSLLLLFNRIKGRLLFRYSILYLILVLAPLVVFSP